MTTTNPGDERVSDRPAKCSCPGRGSSYVVIDPDCTLHGTVAAKKAIDSEGMNNEPCCPSCGVAYAHHPGLTDTCRELLALRAVVKKLPACADGVPIVPGMTVFDVRNGVCSELRGFMTTQPDAHGYSEFRWETGWSSIGRLDRIYSTHEAALAAAEQKGKQVGK